jgi:hypothetical protein
VEPKEKYALAVERASYVLEMSCVNASISGTNSLVASNTPVTPSRRSRCRSLSDRKSFGAQMRLGRHETLVCSV